MPFYEYECKSCGHELEAMQKINDAPLESCPHCGKPQLVRLMSAPVFRLKGAGWYETDFKGDGDNKKNLADRPEGEASSSDDKKPVEAKSDSPAGETAKPAEKVADKADKSVKADKSDNAGKADKGGKADKAATTAAPAPKAAAPEPAKKPAAPAVSKRGVAAAPNKSKAGAAAKKPAAATKVRGPQ